MIMFSLSNTFYYLYRPFLAQMAADIDEVLVELKDNNDNVNGEGKDNDDTDTFLATFVALNAFGLLFSGMLCVLAGKVKLANLASFLPCKFFCICMSHIDLESG